MTNDNISRFSGMITKKPIVLFTKYLSRFYNDEYGKKVIQNYFDKGITLVFPHETISEIKRQNICLVNFFVKEDEKQDGEQSIENICLGIVKDKQ